MSKPKLTLNDYQNETNIRGLITTNQSNHAFRPEPALNTHPITSTICLGKPLEIVLKNPLPLHDNYITTNALYHGHKFRLDEYVQPQLPKAPSLELLNYIRPDFFRKIANGGFNPNPIYDRSETHDKFYAKHRDHDVYGSPALFITHPRDVFVPLNKDAVFHFDRDAPRSVIRLSHPYLTTNQMTHRRFSEQELLHYKNLDAMECTAKRDCDVAIKMRVRPMEDPLEQKFNLPSNDLRHTACSDPILNVKRLFRRPLYTGCPPRRARPVEHFAYSPTTLSTYLVPYSTHEKNNFTSPIKACYLQPLHASTSAMKTPNMYKSENEIYGSGKNVASFVKVGDLDICGDTCVP